MVRNTSRACSVHTAVALAHHGPQYNTTGFCLGLGFVINSLDLSLVGLYMICDTQTAHHTMVCFVHTVARNATQRDIARHAIVLCAHRRDPCTSCHAILALFVSGVILLFFYFQLIRALSIVYLEVVLCIFLYYSFLLDVCLGCI